MLSIIIPTLNEEKNIEQTLLKIEKISQEVKLDVIIVDDNSQDKTIEKALQFHSRIDLKILKNKKNLGLGYALTNGYNLSNSEFVMFLDADLSIGKNDILNLIKSKSEDGIVIGSRYIAGSKIIGANKKKILISYLLNFLVSKIFRLNIIDISHSFRIISKRIKLDSKNFSHPGFFWEITINAKRNNFSLKEVPITFNERSLGISKNKSFLMLLSVIKSLINIIK